MRAPAGFGAVWYKDGEERWVATREAGDGLLSMR